MLTGGIITLAVFCLTGCRATSNPSPNNRMIKRDFTSNTLWNETAPRIRDVRQVQRLDCWWRAAQVAVLATSPTFLRHLFTNPFTSTTHAWEDAPQADWVNVTLWNPKSLEQHDTTPGIWWRDPVEDFGENGVWWSDALDQGVRTLASKTSIPGLYPNGSIDTTSANAWQPLTILTGYRATERLFLNYSSAWELFSDLAEAPGIPVVFITPRVVGKTNPQIGDSHAYPVLNATVDEGGEWKVATRNVWGRTDIFDFVDIWDNGWSVAHLEGWRGVDWPDGRDLSQGLWGWET